MRGDEQAAASSYHEWIKTAEAAGLRTLDGGGRTQGREERRGGEDVRASVRVLANTGVRSKRLSSVGVGMGMGMGVGVRARDWSGWMVNCDS